MLFPCIYVSLIDKHPVMTGSGHTKLYIDYLVIMLPLCYNRHFTAICLMIQLPCFTVIVVQIILIVCAVAFII